MSEPTMPTVLPMHGHWVLRTHPAHCESALTALGWPTPGRLLTARTVGDRSTLWLGPDEWMLIDERIESRGEPIPVLGVSHSCVDVGARQFAFVLKGASGAEWLGAGCPLDLSARVFPVGACTRTVIGKVEVVVWRRAEDHLRVECWPSFAPYVLRFLEMS